eukprot:jgi/Bigna1/126069/aug1.2_g777
MNLLSLENNDLRDYLLYAIRFRMIEDFLAIVRSVCKDNDDETSNTLPSNLWPTEVHFEEWIDPFPEGLLLKEGEVDGLRCIVDDNLSLVGCGDFCTGPRVEDAALSGVAAANAVIKQFKLSLP